MSDWPQVPLRDLTRRITKGTTPTTIGRRFTENGINFIKVESLTEDGHIDPSKIAHIDEATNTLLARSVIEQNDVLFSIAGTIGRVAIAAADILPANTNQAIAIVRGDPAFIDPRFLYFSLRNDVRRRHALARVVQSVQANFSLGELAAMQIPVPPLSEQRAIADVLGVLDDKIEANIRALTTGRQLAMALYSQWCQKDGAIATVAGLALSVTRGVAPKYVEGPGIGVQVLNQKCIRNGWVTTEQARWMHPAPVRPERVARRGDVLVNSTGVGTLGRVGRWIRDTPMHVDGHVSIVRPDPSKYPPSILGYAMLGAQRDIEGLAEGSTGQTELSRDRLGGLALEVPRADDIANLASLLDEADNLGEWLLDENRVLQGLLENLLPKLLSSELRVRKSQAPVG